MVTSLSKSISENGDRPTKRKYIDKFLEVRIPLEPPDGESNIGATTERTGGPNGPPEKSDQPKFEKSKLEQAKQCAILCLENP